MRIILSVVLSLMATVSFAQIRPSFGSMYFQHQYLANPAMAGVDSGLTVYVAHRQQTGGVDGAPNAQVIAATYQLNNFRFGVTGGSDKAGVFNTVRAAASVTYSQPVGNDNQFLHMGISFGGYDRNIRMKNVEGDLDDPTLQQFNSGKPYFDGDLGLAYTDNRLTVQAAIPGFTTAFKKDRDDLNGQMQLFTAVSYRIAPEGLPVSEILPKACYRLLKGSDGVADLGARVNFASYHFGLEAMYHTNSSVTVGLNLSILPKLSVLCMYSTERPEYRAYTKGNMEFGLKASF
ncbi:MAG: PorP/SprF family type IX secretion system membrane protein [Chitinophagaceae bacterium]|nr:PorP/SprF family type IX secretion system membrane protein [Chitinophagaceae bacterium]